MTLFTDKGGGRRQGMEGLSGVRRLIPDGLRMGSLLLLSLFLLCTDTFLYQSF